MDFLIKKFGTDDIKDFIKKYEGKEEWVEYVKSAVEKIQSPEKSSPKFRVCTPHPGDICLIAPKNTQTHASPVPPVPSGPGKRSHRTMRTPPKQHEKWGINAG